MSLGDYKEQESVAPDEQMALNLASPGVRMGQVVEPVGNRMEHYYTDFPEERGRGQDEVASPGPEEGEQQTLPR